MFLLCGYGTALSGTEEARAYYEKGREYVKEGEPGEARKAFEKAVEADPLHGESRYQLALLYARSIQTYGKAEKILFDLPDTSSRAKADARDDLLFRAGVALGKLYIRMGKMGPATQLLRNTILSAPKEASLDDAYNALGLALYLDRLYEDAIFELRRATQANPRNLIARFNIKSIRARMENFQAGKIYARTGQSDEAISMFRKAIALDPRFVEARHRLGVELNNAGNSSEALKELNRAESLGIEYRKVHEIWFDQGLVLIRLDRTAQALEKFQKIVEARPRYAPAYNEIGKIFIREGRYEAAVERFTRAIGLDPRTEYVRNMQLALSRLAASPPSPPPPAPAPVSPGTPPLR